MRKFVLGITFVSALAMTAAAAEWSGYISDAGCTAKQGAAKTAADGHAGCAKACIKRGDKAVLVTTGEKVTLVGEIDADNITVSEVK